MELRYLQSFEAVVRCGGFTKAAEDLHLAQPAVSSHVKRLERHLGVQLLHRSRSVTLSAAGERFLPYVRLVLANLEEGEQLMRSFRSVAAGHVRVAVTPLTGPIDVVAALGRFRARYPGVTVSLRTGLIAPLIDALTHGQVDIVIGPTGPEDAGGDGTRGDGARAGLCRTELAAEHLVLITPLAGHQHITSLSDVKDKPFVCLPPDSGLRSLLDQAFADIGAGPRVDFETHSPASIREMVAADLGCALIAQSIADGPGPDVQVHRLPGLPAHPPISALCAADADPPTTKFLEELTALAADQRVGVAGEGRRG